MAERDYPPDPTGEFKPNPGRARAREYGVSSGPPVTIGERVLGWSRVLLTIATVVYCLAFLGVLYGMEHVAE